MEKIGYQPKARRGCWTCKGRKIGCDRALPSCSNCTRTNRQCQGYGIILSWPQSSRDRRRRNFIPNEDTKYVGSDKFQSDDETAKSLGNLVVGDPGHQFLNTDYNDLARFLGLPSRVRNTILSPKPTNSLPYGYETYIQSHESSLLSYYVNVISRMITTIDNEKNGFRAFLVPIATATSSTSSKSLMKAILALAAFHLHGEQAALKHKVEALRLLSTSLKHQEDAGIAQVSASMMLCVCDVFDLADGSWSLHLSAAKAVADRLRLFDDASYNSGFLKTWLMYHDVLSNYSVLPENVSDEDIIEPFQDTENTMIIGSLGCSLELFKIISCINQLAAMARKVYYLPPNHVIMARNLAARLENLNQMIPISSSISQSYTKSRILVTAEIYRLATQVYLQRSVLQIPRTHPTIQLLVASFLDILSTVEVCTSPWPLFVVACEAVSDPHRVMILDVMERMQLQRRIRNVDMVRTTVETLWKQIDLETDPSKADQICWRDLGLFEEGRIPSFI